MRINQDTVERIKLAADIVEVVGDFISLKKRGANYMACCPFHNEKSPSFNVNPVRQIYKCFGCGVGGDSVKFVMELEKIGYGEALRYLAKKYNIEIEEQEASPEEINRQNERESLLIVLNFAQQNFQNLLMTHDEGQAIGLSYFRNRGFNDQTIKLFGLGYSLNEWDNLGKAATQRGYNIELLEKAGLVIKAERRPKEDERNAQATRHYDRFRGRVVFPIHNVSGKVIAFGARILTNDKTQAKYINSPETEVYHKSNSLYGIFQAKNAIRQEDVCYLVEGYTDVISLHQAGIQNVVASSGTSLTIEQIRLIARFTPNITILYDGDAAGIKAALRGLDMVLEEGLNVSLVTLPDGEDPDSYVYKVGAEGFKAHVKQATKDFIAFKTEMLLREAGDNPFKRAEAIGEIVGSIAKIPDAIKRQIFTQRTAATMKVDEQTLLSEGNKLLRKQIDKVDNQAAKEKNRNAPPAKQEWEGLVSFSEESEVGFLEESPAPAAEKPSPISTPPSRSRLFYQEQECVRLLINYASVELEPNYPLCRYAVEQLTELNFETPQFEHIWNSFREAYGRNEILNTNYFIDHFDPDIQLLAVDLVSKYDQYSLDDWERKQIEVPTEIKRLAEAAYKNFLWIKLETLQMRRKQVISLIVDNPDPVNQTALQLEFIHMNEKITTIANLLGNVVSG
ncbi:MAG: DNA primase [Cytophagia bacterium]|nr:MAG: DNA primase [Cytophagales bacterium]TAG39800.1 MAG: DNA primase [Cytophagia bacterium]TAG75466.1 MAG: DNA primase [Runella slithyformis]TAG81443.1 MAG: DNA primase [Cytophagales bacterium]